MLKLEYQRSGQQNKMFHAILGQIAKQAQHLGSTWTTEDWKRLHLHNFCKWRGLDAGRLVQALDGEGLVQLGLQSRKLSKEEAIEFTEYLLAWCAENGVTIHEVPQAPIRPQQGAFRGR